MDRNEFLANFADQFDDTDPSEITFETRFRDLEEWGSLKGLLVMAMVSDNYGKELKAEDIRKSDTVEDLYWGMIEKICVCQNKSLTRRASLALSYS